MIQKIHIKTKGQGLHDFTEDVKIVVHAAKIKEGICHLFLQHTSASLIIQENADPSAKIDLENWMNRLVQENDPIYTHTLEGSDDMPSHIKVMLTANSLSIPIVDSQLALGTWQGIYLWEHRRQSQDRTIVVYVGK